MGAEDHLDAVLSLWAEGGEITVCPLSGDSMAPLIRQGDVLTIRHGRGSFRKGSIIVFRASEKLLVHRVVRRERSASGEILCTKGDNSRAFDPPLLPDQVVGEVIEVRGSNGHLRLTSRFWIISSWLLATISSLSVRLPRRGLPSGTIARQLRRLPNRTLPRIIASRNGIVRAMCAADRAFVRARVCRDTAPERNP